MGAGGRGEESRAGPLDVFGHAGTERSEPVNDPELMDLRDALQDLHGKQVGMLRVQGGQSGW